MPAHPRARLIECLRRDGQPALAEQLGTKLFLAWGKTYLAACCLALGEHTVGYPGARALCLVKVDTGIGTGIVIDGRTYRGADGGAGDIGHVRLRDRADSVCQCGAFGCLAAVASGRGSSSGTEAANSTTPRSSISPSGSNRAADRAVEPRSTAPNCSAAG